MTQLIDMPDAVASTQPRNRLHALGVITVVAGILGAASAIVIIAWPDQVSDPGDSLGA